MKVKLSLLLCLLAIPALTQTTTVLTDIIEQCDTTWWDLPLKQKAKRIVHPQGLGENVFYHL